MNLPYFLQLHPLINNLVMKFSMIFLSIILLLSCNKPENKVILKNVSNTEIDSLFFYDNSKWKALKFVAISTGEIKKQNFTLCDKSITEGNYIIELFTKKGCIKKGFGYYLNGGTPFDSIMVTINKKLQINTKEYSSY